MNNPSTSKPPSQLELLLEALQGCRNKLYSALGDTRVGGTSDKIKRCHELTDLAPSYREDFVRAHWTEQDLENVRYLLVQLEANEKHVTDEQARISKEQEG